MRHVHAVTLVAPYSLNPRLAVSGWFVKGDPLNPMGYTHRQGVAPQRQSRTAAPIAASSGTAIRSPASMSKMAMRPAVPVMRAYFSMA